jgi:Iap family predicted aminopeptidase
MVEKTSISEIRKTVEHLCAFGQKVAGTKAEVQAADYLHDSLLNFGFTKVEKQPFNVHGWNPISCTVKMKKPIEKEIDAALFPYCKTENVEGALVVIGSEEQELSSPGKGLIAFSEWGPDDYLSPRMTYFRAANLGYEGLIVAAPDEGDLLKVVVLASGGLLKIPVVCITKEEGAKLLAMMKERDVIVSIATNVEISSGSTSYNVVGTLEGDGTSEQEIIVGAHYDSWFQGAADNCAPAATVLELSRLFVNQAQAGKIPKRTIRFIFYGAEESGSNDFYFWINGSKAYVKDNPESVARTAAVLSLDSTGYTTPAKDYIYATADLFDFAKSIKVDLERLLPLIFLDPPSYGSDHWFFELAGVPTIYGVAFRSPLYHTQKDDPDHLDFEAVHFYAEFMKEALSFLTGIEILPIDIFLPLKRFQQIIMRYNKMDGNPFDLKSILTKIESLLKQEPAFRKLLASAKKTGSGELTSKVNRFLLSTANKFNQTIGWTTRPLETYNSDYLHRFELIADYIHLSDSIQNLRKIPIAAIDLDSVARIEKQDDNPYNWIRLHEPLAKLDEEQQRIRKEIDELLENISTMMDQISEDIGALV